MKTRSEKKSSRSSGKKSSSERRSGSENSRRPKLSASTRTAIGLDLSFRGTGLVVVRGEAGKPVKVVRHRHLRTEGFPSSQELKHQVSGLRESGTFRGDNEECVEYIRRSIRKSVLKYEPDIVVIEDYAYSKFSRSLTVLHEVGGVVKNLLHREGAVWLTQGTQQNKKFATGTGTADKTEMLLAAKVEWPGCTNSDLADAYWLAKSGIWLYDELIEIAEQQESESA